VNHEMLMSIRGPDFDLLARKGSSSSEATRLDTAFRAEGIFLDGQVAQFRGYPAQEVIHHYDQAINTAPWNRNLRNEVVSYYYREYLRQYFRGDYTEALAILRRVVEIYPESSDVHQDYGWMLWKMNQTDLAIKELQQALVINAKLVPVRRILASIYASRGEVEQAMEQWKEALTLDPNDIPTIVSYGIFLLNQQPGTEAAAYLLKAYQLDPEDPEVIDGYARALYLNGYISEARRIVLKGGDYYKTNPFFEQRRAAMLNGN